MRFPMLPCLILAVGFVAVEWLFLWFLQKHKVFLKV